MITMPRSRQRLARRLGWFAVASLVVASFAPATFAAPGDKLTICHATGSAGNPFIPIEVDAEAGDLAPHLDSNGSPLNGHEGDFLLPKAGFDAECNAIEPTPAPPTPAPPTPEPPTPAPPTPAPPTPAPTPTPEGGVGGATATPPAATAGTTLPPTDTLGDAAPATGGDSWRIVLLALAATLAAALLLTPARAVRKDT